MKWIFWQGYLLAWSWYINLPEYFFSIISSFCFFSFLIKIFSLEDFKIDESRKKGMLAFIANCSGNTENIGTLLFWEEVVVDGGDDAFRLLSKIML